MASGEYSWPDLTLDVSYLETGIMGLFLIDLISLAKTKAVLLKNFRLQPSEVDRMVYWEYEYLLESLNEQIKEENERQQAEMDKYKVQERLNSLNSKPKYPTPPKMPTMPSFGSMTAPPMRF